MRPLSLVFMMTVCVAAQTVHGDGGETTWIGNCRQSPGRTTDGASTVMPSMGREYNYFVITNFWISIIGHSITETDDGGSMVAGIVSYNDFCLLVLIKYAPSGVITWTAAVLDVVVNHGDSVQQTPDGGYIVTGSTSSGDILLMKYDASGEVTWARAARLNSDAAGNSVRRTADGGYVVVGSARSGGGVTLVLLKFDELGQMQWVRAAETTLQSATREYVVQQTSDVGYIVVGSGFSDVLLMKFDSGGALSWARAAGGGGEEHGRSCQQTADGGYIVAGDTASFGAGDYDVFLLKFDWRGRLEWARTAGGAGIDRGNSVRQTADGGYIVAGETASYGAGGYDVLLLKFDAAGNLAWARTAGGSESDYGVSVRQAADGGYVTAGRADDEDSSETLLLKVDADGFIDSCPEIQSCCPETTSPDVTVAVPLVAISTPPVILSAPALYTSLFELPYEVICGDTPPPTPMPTPVTLIPTKMTILYRAKTGSPPDYFSTNLSSDLVTHPHDGQLFYVLDTPSKTTSPHQPQALFRLHRENDPASDHMDSLDPNEGAEEGYQRQLSLGYNWDVDTKPDGTVPIVRYYHPITGDHATGSGGDPIGLMGYIVEKTLGYGYQRHRNADCIGLPLGNGRDDDLLTIQSNLAAGGALWEWNWNGMQFVNDHDYGRNIQTTLWHRGANPTEAGDSHSAHHLNPAMRHGSPVLEAVNEGLTQRTIAMPLEFNIDNYGVDKDHLQLYENVRLGKEITLAWNDMPRVAQYDTLVYVPAPLDIHGIDNIQVPWVSLRAVFSRFYRFSETFLTFQDITSEVWDSRCIGNYQWTPQGAEERWGGLVVSTADENYAFGLLIDTDQPAVSEPDGMISMMVYFFYDCPEQGFGSETGQFDNPTTILLAKYHGLLPSPGYSSFRSYLLCGTLEQVEADLIAACLFVSESMPAAFLYQESPALSRWNKTGVP